MQNLTKAITHLQKDLILNEIIKKYGVLEYPKHKDYFQDIVSSIIGQQLSNKAADTIYGRFIKLLPNNKVIPENILKLELAQIRTCGTSWAKAGSLHDLSQKTLDGTLKFSQLEKMTDGEMIEHLIQVKGIGRWSAEMLLMFSFHRPDVFPIDDRGIQNAFKKLFGLKDGKSLQAKMTKIAAPWQPYRTLACWYLWKSLDNK